LGKEGTCHNCYFLKRKEKKKTTKQLVDVPINSPWILHNRTEKSNEEVSRNWSLSIIFKLEERKLC